MSNDRDIRVFIKKHGKEEAHKQFKRMASFSYNQITLDHLGDEIKEIIKEAVISMGTRGLAYLAEDQKYTNKIVVINEKNNDNS